MRAAMKSGDAVRLQTLRLALAGCTNMLVEMKKRPNDELGDDEVIKVMKRLVKQRNEAAAQYRAAEQEERAKAEDAERAVLESYLPSEMPEEEVRAIVLRVRDELNVSDKKDKGRLMKAVMQELKGKADGSVIAGIVEEALA